MSAVHSIQVHDEAFGTVTVPLRGIASVAPRSVETRTTADCTTRPMTVNEARGLFAKRHSVARMRRVMSAARAAETARRVARDEVTQAVAAAAEIAPQAQRRHIGPLTLVQAYEARYAELRQARREIASLMARRPHEGRPPMVGTVSGTAANAQETRAAKRWAPSWVARLHRDWDVNPCKSSRDDGASWVVMDRPARKSSRSRKGRAVESLGRNRPNVASGIAGTVRMAEQG